MAKFIKFIDSNYLAHIVNVEHIVDITIWDDSISFIPVYGTSQYKTEPTIFRSRNKEDILIVKSLIEDFLLNDDKILDLT